MNDDWLAKIAKKWKIKHSHLTWTIYKTLLRKWDIYHIIEEQAH